jgi:hypothetical protein
MIGGEFRGLGAPCGGPDCGDTCGTIRAGDANADGLRNNFDIDAWVLGVSDPTRYIALYCYGGEECRVCRLDMNLDGFVNGFDIDPFVACFCCGDCP